MRRLTAAAAAAAALLLVACSPDAADFKEEAEKYIESRAFSEEAPALRYPEVSARNRSRPPRTRATRARPPPRTAANGSSTWRSPAKPTSA